MSELPSGVFMRLCDAIRRYGKPGGPDEDDADLAVALGAWTEAGFPLYNADLPDAVIERALYRRHRVRLRHKAQGYLLALKMAAAHAEQSPWAPDGYWMLKERARRSTADLYDEDTWLSADGRVALVDMTTRHRHHLRLWLERRAEMLQHQAMMTLGPGPQGEEATAMFWDGVSAEARMAPLEWVRQTPLYRRLAELNGVTIPEPDELLEGVVEEPV